MKTVKDSRGFTTAAEFKCTYGTEVRIKESSSAMAPHIWLFLEEDATVLTKPVAGHAAAHLNIKQAKRLVESLQYLIQSHYQLTPATKRKRAEK